MANIFEPDTFEEYDSEGDAHPTPQQLLLRMAVDKALNPKQKRIWEYYNYDRLTTVEIGKLVGLDQSTISRNIKVIEKKLSRWCLDHKEFIKTMEAANASED